MTDEENAKKLLHVADLIKIYRHGAKNLFVETIALRGLTFDVFRGEMIAIVGPSGAGKSTLVHLLGGLDRPSAGSITYYVPNDTKNEYKEVQLTKLSETELDFFRSRYIGFVFQQNNLIPSLTALENVMLPLKFLGLKNPRKRAIKMLERVGLEHRLHHKPFQLSGGEKQRVAIAAALAPEPLIIFADEPTGELDSHTTREIISLFKELNKELGMTMFIVTHNTNVASQCNKIMALRDGMLHSIKNMNSYFESITQVIAKKAEFHVYRQANIELSIPVAALEQAGFSTETLIGMRLQNNQLIVTPISPEEIYNYDAIARISSDGNLLLQPQILKKIPSQKTVFQAKIEHPSIIIYIN